MSNIYVESKEIVELTKDEKEHILHANEILKNLLNQLFQQDAEESELYDTVFMAADSLQVFIAKAELKSNLNIGVKVVMNDRYDVNETRRGKVFTVMSRPFDICGTKCVLLDGYSGGYAIDGLTKVKEP